MGKSPVVIGIAGGSGSGKTSVTRSIYEQFKGHSILMIQQDLYYKDQSHLPFEERLNTNYDHPLAFDNDYLIEHIQELLNYRPIEKPIYDYNCIRVLRKPFRLSRRMSSFWKAFSFSKIKGFATSWI